VELDAEDRRGAAAAREVRLRHHRGAQVPVTVLSRCQRFDLRRVEPEALAGHLAEICRRERVEASRTRWR
jgi:hypothetical protein